MREPLGVLHDAVEEITVDHEQPQALRRAMDRLLADRDAAERDVEKVARGLVVIAGDVYDLGAFARLAQNLLHDVVVTLLPVPPPAELPPVDDVADEVEIVGVRAAQEIQQPRRLATWRSEMRVGYPDGAEALRRARFRAHRAHPLEERAEDRRPDYQTPS